MKIQKVIVAATLLLSMHSKAQERDQPARTTPLINPKNMNTSVKPGDNFYEYANGAWLQRNPIPAEETRWGSFNELIENNYKQLLRLLESAAEIKTVDDKNFAAHKVGQFYKSGMDEDAIEAQGISPLRNILSRIERARTPELLMQEIATEHTEGIGSVFGFYVSPDDKNVSKQMPQLFQGGLGMPDKDYYTKTDERSTKIREAYKNYLTVIFKLAKDENPNLSAQQVFDIELKLANASMSRTEMRDPYKIYHKFHVDAFSKTTPGIDWKVVFGFLKIKGQDSLIVGQPAFFNTLAEMLKNTAPMAWQKYLTFHVISDMAPYLNRDFVNAQFEFYGRTLRGQQEQKPRWKRVLTVIDGSIGEYLGQMYVDKYFNARAKERMLSLVNNLQETYASRIQRLDWMSATTKKKALGKLNTFIKKIGYPDQWKDYSSIRLNEKDYVGNILNASAFEYNYNIQKLGKPIDKKEWGMTPPTVNAYYNPAFNEIVFPAGILQFPFFELQADDAVNYGGIGAVIGHEMTHGFDDQGRQYDADGNLNDWWTKEDAKKFDEKANVLVQQFNKYTVLDTIHVNGKLTLGENLADLGGLAIAYEAFKKTDQGKKNEKIDGFTPDQRFFLSWAQVWKANTRPAEMANRIITDPHSPSEFRCNGPLSNMEEFYKAFNVQLGDKMYKQPKDRLKVW